MKSTKIKILVIGITSLVAVTFVYLWFRLTWKAPEELVNMKPDFSSVEPVPTVKFESRLLTNERLEAFIKDGNISPDTAGIDLSVNTLTDLPESINNFKELLYLKLAFNDFKKVPECLKGHTKLTHLDLSYNDLEKGSLKALVEIPNLTHLNIAGCKLNDGDLEMLGDLPKLNFLNISLNELGEKGAEKISKLDNLRYLVIKRGINNQNAKHILNMKNLTHLDVKFCDLEDEKIEYICKLHNLKDLRLSHCKISVEGLKKLAKLPKLRVLDITESEIQGDTGDLHLTLESLLEIKTLEEICMSKFGLSDDKLNHISEKAGKKKIGLYIRQL